jgi:hypothetical protein
VLPSGVSLSDLGKPFQSLQPWSWPVTCRPATPPAQAVTLARRLALEWGAWVVRAHALRKVFVSVKGIYFQVRGRSACKGKVEGRWRPDKHDATFVKPCTPGGHPRPAGHVAGTPPAGASPAHGCRLQGKQAPPVCGCGAGCGARSILWWWYVLAGMWRCNPCVLQSPPIWWESLRFAGLYDALTCSMLSASGQWATWSVCLPATWLHCKFSSFSPSSVRSWSRSSSSTRHSSNSSTSSCTTLLGCALPMGVLGACAHRGLATKRLRGLVLALKGSKACGAARRAASMPSDLAHCANAAPIIKMLAAHCVVVVHLEGTSCMQRRLMFWGLTCAPPHHWRLSSLGWR